MHAGAGVHQRCVARGCCGAHRARTGAAVHASIVVCTCAVLHMVVAEYTDTTVYATAVVYANIVVYTGAALHTDCAVSP
eukprot:218256-Pyramimonas_sp.AAC.1